ncbi:MAG: ribonuclease HII [Bacteroidota bacterium]
MLLPNIDPTRLEAGCDEAGRGCIAGPVYAAAVIIPESFSKPELLKDSKLLSEAQRLEARYFIEEEATAWAVGIASPAEIDQINILNASFLAMHRAIEQLDPQANYLLIDGNRFKPYTGIEHECVVKGDQKYQSIAAASILAKTYRDEYMLSIEVDHPQYGWKTNKGYPTKAHREAVLKHGFTEYHRRTFKVGVPK